MPTVRPGRRKAEKERRAEDRVPPVGRTLRLINHTVITPDVIYEPVSRATEYICRKVHDDTKAI